MTEREHDRWVKATGHKKYVQANIDIAELAALRAENEMLYEVLADALEDHCGTDYDGQCEADCWSHTARATLAKARGET